MIPPEIKKVLSGRVPKKNQQMMTRLDTAVRILFSQHTCIRSAVYANSILGAGQLSLYLNRFDLIIRQSRC